MNAHQQHQRTTADRIAMIRHDRRVAGPGFLGAHRFIGIVLLISLHLCKGPTVLGQDRDFAPRDQTTAPRDGRSVSPLKKLDLFQKSVKRKLKSALGVKESDPQPQANDLRPMESSAQDANARYQNNIGSEIQPQRPDQYSDQRTTEGYPPNRTRSPESNGDLKPVVIAADGDWVPTEELREDPSDSSRYPMRAVQYRQIPDRLPEPKGQMQRPLPAPVTDPVAAGYPSGPPNYSARDNPSQWDGGGTHYADWGDTQSNVRQFDPYGGQQAPAARGTWLGNPQVTATQHALRLIEENGDLKARLAGTDAENQRLKEKLAESQRLLARSTQAVQSAHEEIDAMAATNRDLQKKLSELESQHNRHLLETDRMLQTIREELDDVLVREISAKGR